MRQLLPLAVLAAAGWAHAQPSAPVSVEGAWVRATVQGQSATGGFMKLTAREPLSLVAVATPVAGVAEVHEMTMEGQVMKMRALEALELPAGKTVELKPGAHHLMLMDLKMQLKPDTQIPVTLTLRDAKGQQRKLELSVPVRGKAPGTFTPPAAHKH